MSHSKKYFAALTLILLAAVALPVQGQDALRSWGLTGSSTARAFGIEGVGCNPALLADTATDGVFFGLASLGMDLGNNTLSLSRYNEISGAVLDARAKDQLLSEIPASGLQVDAGLDATLLGFRAGRFALSAQALGMGAGRLDRDVIELVLLGNEIDRAFNFEDTDGQAFALGAATLSYAQPLWSSERLDLAAGLNLRYLMGFLEFRALEASGGLETTLDGLSGSARAHFLSAQGGSGYSADLGLSLRFDSVWRAGLMWEGLLGSMTWDRGVEHHLWTADAEEILLGADDLDEAVVDSDSTWAGQAYSGTLPQTLRLGLLRDWKQLSFAMETELPIRRLQGSDSGAGFMLGGEWRARSWLRPRIGLGFGGALEGAVAGLGLHLGFFHADFYAGVKGGHLPGAAQGLSLGSAISMGF